MKRLPRPRLQPHSPTTAASTEFASAAEDSVLLIEDDPVISRSLQRHLRMNGFAVSSASRMQEVLNMNAKFAIGVFDIDLPEKNGVEMARHCLDRGIVKQVIFYSAVEHGTLRDLAENMGEFIEKQSGVGVLLERVIDSYKASKPRKRLIAVG